MKKRIIALLLLASLVPISGKTQCLPSSNGSNCGAISPTQSATGSTTICASATSANRTITFNYTTAILVDQVCIDFGDNNFSTIIPTSTSITFTHTYSYPQTDFCPSGFGQPPVIFDVVANFYKSCSGQFSFDKVAQQVTVIFDPRPKIASISSQCINDMTCITVGACTGLSGTSLCSCTNADFQHPGSYTWDFGDGTSQSFNNVTDNLYQDICHTYASGGTYTITLSATNICGTRTDSKPNLHFVKVDTLQISGLGHNCTGDTVTLNLTGSGGGGTYFTSVTPSVLVNDANTNHPSIRFDSAGIYRIRVSYGPCTIDSLIEIFPGVNMSQVDIPDSCFYGSFTLDLSQYYITNNFNQVNTATITKNGTPVWSGGLTLATLSDTGMYTVAVSCSTSCNTANYSQSFILNEPVNISPPVNQTRCLQDTINIPSIGGIAPSYNGPDPNGWASNPFHVSYAGAHNFVYTPACGNPSVFTIYTQGTAAYCTDTIICAYAADFTLPGIPGMLFSGNYVSGTTYQAAAAPAGNNYFYSSYTDTNNCTFLDTGIVNVLSPWVATYLLDDTVCVNAATNFTNDSAWLSYVINWGDGTINSNASHAYAQPGTYYINIRFFLAQCDTFIDDSVVIIPAPDASFSFAPNTICAGDTAAILFAPSSLYSYQWIYLSNTTSFPPVITNTNTGPDLISLPVTLIASVAQCGSASYTDSIHFYPATQALMALDYDSACSPMAVTIINNSIVSSLGASYQWFKNGVRWDSTDMRIHQQYDTLNAFSNDTTYTFMLVVYSCGQYDTVVQSIVVHPVDFTPVIYTSLPNPCRFQEIMLSASAIPGCTVAYNFGDGTTATASSGDTIMHTYYTAGYKVVYMVMHCACKSKTDSLVLNILPGPDLTVSAPSDTCNNKPVTITSNVTGVIAPAAYTTYFGDGTYDFTVPNPVHWYATGGIDTGWMVVTGVNGCYSDTARFIVHVHQTPNVLLSVTDTFACSSVLKLFSTDSLTPNSTYNWTLFYHNDSAHVTTYDGVLPFYADDIGTWLISLTAYNNNYPTCVATSDSFTVSVYQTPDAFFTVEQLYVKDKQCQFQVHNKSTPDNNIYFWDFGDSTYSYETNPAAHGYYKGRYQITLIARNGPCEDTAINPVQVDPYAQIFIPNIFTPDMDGTNDYFQLFGNTQDIDFLHVKIFNRAGEIVYDSYNVNFSWNGTYKGEPLAPAVFVYIIEISALADEDNRLMKGSITILR